MNLLQSFVGCLYPESIRTDSIESMDHYDLANCRFQASNIDERGKEVSQGELQLTEKDLIYFRPAKFPIRWPLECIRRYGYKDQLFIFESGRRCDSGEAIFAFRVNSGDLVDRLKEKIERSSLDGKHIHTITHQNDVTPTHTYGDLDPRPLTSYALIEHNMSKALEESKQAHEANRVKLNDPRD